MNHAAVIEHESKEPYQHRSYVLGKLDVRHFDALNPGGLVLGINGYCLDALEVVPAGCMRQGGRWPGQHLICRGVSWDEQQALRMHADQIIDEIVAEEAQVL